MDSDRPLPPKPVRSGVFTYDSNGIKAGGISRQSVSDLRLLFRKNASRARVRAAKKPWITAQLQLYGIPFEKSNSLVQLRGTLEVALKAGKCNNIVPSILELQKSLSEQYEQRLELYTMDLDKWRMAQFSRLESPTEEANFDLNRFLAKYFLTGLHGQPAPNKTKEALVLGYVNQFDLKIAVQAIPGLAVYSTDRVTVVGWKFSLKRGLDEAFANLSSPGAVLHIPTSEANFDPDRFLTKYFLDTVTRKPAPEKTPEPIVLYPFFVRGAQLQTAAASIPGLRLCRVDGIHGPETIIGWDMNKMKLRKREIEEEKTRTEAEEAAATQAAKDDTWQQVLQSHRQYMKNYQAPAGPLKLEHLTGSYVVRCKKVEDEYGDGEVMTLDIAQPCNAYGAIAAFDFGVVKGTMLMALSEDALYRLREDQEVDSEEDVDPDMGYSDFDSYRGGGELKRRKNHTAPQPIEQRIEKSLIPNHIYAQWAGRDPGTGEIQLDFDNEHTCYLDFDASKAFTEGELRYPSFFGNTGLEFTAHKVADRPLKFADEWLNFSEKQYNYESRARWGR